MGRDTSNASDYLDVRDLIERFEELESEREDLETEAKDAADAHDAALNGAPDADHDLAATHEENALALARAGKPVRVTVVIKDSAIATKTKVAVNPDRTDNFLVGRMAGDYSEEPTYRG